MDAKPLPRLLEASLRDALADTPVVCLLGEQQAVTTLGGTQRLGAYPCHLKAGTKARAAYGVDVTSERHRHRYEVNNHYRERLAARGMVFSGTSPDGGLVEAIELADHPWFVAVQSHPEFLSKPTKPHPLFRDFIGASLERRRTKKSDTRVVIASGT